MESRKRDFLVAEKVQKIGGPMGKAKEILGRFFKLCFDLFLG